VPYYKKYTLLFRRFFQLGMANNKHTLSLHIKALKYKNIAEVGNSFSDASNITEASDSPEKI